MAWRFGRADRAGSWRWFSATGEQVQEVLNRLGDFESQNLAQLRDGGSHPVPVADLCKEAQDRLAAIEQDDLDDLMSFRVTGRRRVWCIRDRNIMHILWWDPNHEVCPSLKRNT